MSSKAFYKRAAPQLVHRLKVPNPNNKNRAPRMIEVWITTCIVTNFGKNATESSDVHCSSSNNSTTTTWTLVNPSNPGLTGCRNFTYFPRGGPVPDQTAVASSTVHRDWQPLGFASTWGGMDVGHGMMFPATVVDGLVHLHGGWKLQAELQWMRSLQTVKAKLLGDGSGSSSSSDGELCPVGRAVRTSAPGDLRPHYDAIVHTTPPFYRYYGGGDGDDNPETALARCYASALAVATAAGDDDQHNNNNHNNHNHNSSIRIATPLLGAGCRGFPEDVACRVAARAVVSTLRQQQATTTTTKTSKSKSTTATTVAFGLLEKDTAAQLIEALQEAVVDDNNEP